MIWMASLAFVTVYVDIPVLEYEMEVGVHMLIGVIMVILGAYNLTNLRKTEAPARLVRICTATLGLIVLQGILGILLRYDVLAGIISIIHLGSALAIIAQAASVATAHDMWEEKEFA
jgi:uncharacterized membrane protein